MKKVSVIVPAYNAHDTLARCLGSLVNQTLRDIEVVVVNDASSDDTLEIMNRCKAQYPDKVTLVDSKENLGCGGARNMGLDAASGEYIGFSDSDDYVAPTMYESLYKRAKDTDADIVDSGFYSEAKDKAMLFASDDLTGELDDDKRSGLIAGGGYLVTKIFKNELFNDPKVRMQEHMAALEDLEILIYMYLKAQKLETVKEVFYYYCDRAGSNTKIMDPGRYLDSVYRAIKYTYETCHGLSSYEGSRLAVEYMLGNVYSYGINRCLYDQIIRFGADAKNVEKYFEAAGAEETELLKKLSDLRKEVIRGSFRDNPCILKKISELDIQIMEECDRRF